MTYTKEDFNKCVFNPLEKNLLAKYPRLQSLKLHDERIVKYIIVLYDYNSPLVKEYRDLQICKQVAATFAGFDYEKDQDLIQGIATFKKGYDYVLDAIDVFLKEFINSMLWYGICSNRETYYEYGKRLMQPISADDTKEKDLMASISAKSKLSADMEDIRTRIENGIKKLYGDDGLEKAMAAKKGFRPEDNAISI